MITELAVSTKLILENFSLFTVRKFIYSLQEIFLVETCIPFQGWHKDKSVAVTSTGVADCFCCKFLINQMKYKQSRWQRS